MILPLDKTPPARTLAEEVVAVALSQVGVREHGRNRGPEVDEYLRAAGLDPTKGAYAWCASFVVWVFKQAALNLGTLSPCPRRAGVMRLWEDSPPASRIRMTEARDNYELVQPGMVFIMDKGRGLGHCGIVTGREGNLFRSVEGNTDPGGSREGDGVYERERPIAGVLGFIRFG